MALALMGAPAAAVGAPHNAATHRQVVRLEHTVRNLRRQLRAARSWLAATQAHSASQTSSFQATVEQLAVAQQQIAALNVQVSSLQAQLAAIPTPLAVADTQVGRDVAWFHDHIGLSGYPDGELYALAAMNYVAGHVDAPATSEAPPFVVTGPPDIPSEADQILGAQLGSCSLHVIAFDAIMAHFGYQTRPVSFYYEDTWTQAAGAHSSVEVYYGGAWHYFDPYWNLYWTDPATGNVLDIQTERATLAGVEHEDRNAFLDQFEGLFYAGGDAAGFETDPATNVVIG